MSRKNHAAANTDPIIRKAAASHIAAIDLKDLITTEAAIDLNVLITIDAAALAKDVERKSIIPTAEEMLIANGTKGTCGSIAATAKHQIIFFETLFKREYDKKGFFLFHREIK
ncbi:hypothetical protein [Bacillus pumilus]|uniref:hypothetical protein n=1 Tax=Bacillus pumilus TaxID=1408 RepID=UPI001483CBE8|nr:MULTISPECIES: hypothetical protein [Bacillus]